MTLGQACQAAQIDPKTLYAWGRGRSPKTEALQRFAEAVGAPHLLEFFPVVPTGAALTLRCPACHRLYTRSAASVRDSLRRKKYRIVPRPVVDWEARTGTAYCTECASSLIFRTVGAKGRATKSGTKHNARTASWRAIPRILSTTPRGQFGICGRCGLLTFSDEPGVAVGVHRVCELRWVRGQSGPGWPTVQTRFPDGEPDSASLATSFALAVRSRLRHQSAEQLAIEFGISPEEVAERVTLLISLLPQDDRGSARVRRWSAAFRAAAAASVEGENG